MPEVSASFQPVPTDGEARTSSALDRPSSSLGGEAFPQAEPSSDPTYPDPSTLPPAYAAAFAPKINPTEAGTFSGMAIYDTDIQALAEKNWRRPGADVTDWFNYGFDEISWEAYCVRRRDMAALAAELKANVLASILQLGVLFLYSPAPDSPACASVLTEHGRNAGRDASELCSP